MVDRLKGKTALVFGAGSVGEGWGNGKAAAVAYAREGAKVACVDIGRPAADATAKVITEEGGVSIATVADVTRLAEVQAAVDETMKAFGRIDILHNNVGISLPGGPVEASEESWDKVMDVNAKSVFLTCKAVLPIMESQGGGAIVNISSLAGIRWTGYPYISYYASKAAVNNFTRAIAVQYAARNIRANCILPGVMDTPHIYEQISGYYESVEAMVAARNEIPPMKRMGDGWDIAMASVFLASDEAKYITGVELSVDGGLHCTVV